MGIQDKFDAAADKVSGKAKETAGDVTGDDDLKAEGKFEQAKGHLKDAGESVKNAAENAKDNIKDALSNDDK